MSNKKFFQKIFYDNRVILILSILFAIVFWIFVALERSPEEVRIVQEVPVVIDLENSVPSQFGLEIFGTKEFYVDVTVVGRRYEVSSSALSADDFLATAQTSYVDSEGKHTLQVKVVSKDDDADYQITGYSDESIEVYFDTYTEGEYTLVADIEGENFIPEGYVTQDSIISTSKIIIGGPTTEIAKIDQVVARVSVDKTLTETTTLKAEIIPMNEFGGTLRYLTIDSGGIDITVTIPVLKEAFLKTSVIFKNAPANYISNPLAFTCTPANAKIGIPESLLDSTGTFSVASIDFSEISEGENTFTINADDISGGVVLDNTKSFKITVFVPDISKKSININCMNLNLSEVSNEYTLSIAQKGNISVSVVGNEDSFNALDLTEITAMIVNPETIREGTQKMRMKLYLTSANDCWIYGSYYVTVKAVPIEGL